MVLASYPVTSSVLALLCAVCPNCMYLPMASSIMAMKLFIEFVWSVVDEVELELVLAAAVVLLVLLSVPLVTPRLWSRAVY